MTLFLVGRRVNPRDVGHEPARRNPMAPANQRSNLPVCEPIEGVMEPSETSTLLRLSRRRFRNFSEAASEVLEALAEVLPGVVALGRLDQDERVHHVMEVRGDGVGGLERGATMPLAGDGLDGDFLRSLGAQAWVSIPLEMSDGSIAGVLCAVDAAADVYRIEHEAQLGVAARLLGHEWESVELRSELRRLRSRVNVGPTTDADTGLANREGFLDLVDHEWRLVERGLSTPSSSPVGW